MYKVSKFVDVERQGQAIYLKNTLLDGEVEITEPYLHELDRVLSAGSEKIQSELESFLFEHKYLVEETIAESEIEQLLLMMHDTIIIGILPTMGCNFRCTYCYEDHVGKLMSEVTLEKIKQFLEREIVERNIKYVQVNWFGGEPTLCEECIYDFNRYVLNLKEKYGFSFLSGITTNGYLLNVTMFKKFYELGIENYQITLDGWKHDTFRKHVNGEKTLHKIIENLKEISSLPKQYEYIVKLRYNISHNNQEVSWYDYIKDIFGSDERFSVYINFVKDWGGESVKELELCNEHAMNNLEKQHVLYMNKIGLKNDNTSNRKIVPLKNVCYAAYPNSYIFTPDNRVLKCTVALKEVENQIGSVDAMLGVVIDEKKKNAWIDTTLEHCGGCKYIISCLHRACPRQIVVDGKSSESCVLKH